MQTDFKDGFISSLPIGLSVFAYGSVLGMLCTQNGVGVYELIIMNLFIFAGSAQFVLVEMWQESLVVFEMVMAAIIINLRYLLIGASLNTLFLKTSFKEKLAYMHLVADENWAVTMVKAKEKKIGPRFLFGGGVCLLSIWMAGTLVGFALGAFIKEPAMYGLDFAFTAIFTALCVSLYKGKHDIVPFCVAACVAIVSEMYIAGKWYIVLGGLSGALSAAMLYKDEKELAYASA